MLNKLVILMLVAFGAVAQGQQRKWWGAEGSGESGSDRFELRELSDLDGEIGYMRSTFKVIQVVDGNNSILKNLETQKLIWFTAPTDSITDDLLIDVLAPVKVSGTKTYSAVNGGSNTIWHVDVLSGKELDEYLKGQAVRQAEAKKKAAEQANREKLEREKAIEDREYRTFSSADGKFSVEAKFVEMKINPKTGTDIKLIKREDKKEIVIKSTVLSAADMKWIQSKIKADKKEKDQKALDDKLIKSGVTKYSPDWIRLGGSEKPQNDSNGLEYGQGF